MSNIEKNYIYTSDCYYNIT